MTMFLRNVWYMAGWSSEIGQSLLRRRLFGEPVLLFRRDNGAVAAMIDRCPHRFAPLSMGERTGDQVTCGYHGLTFDAEGQCVRNPFSDTLPKGATVRTFVVAERDGIVWLWAGDANRADPATIPDFSVLFIEGHGAPVTGYLPMAAHYEYGTDNLLDLSHIEYVHKGSFAGNGVIFAGEHSITETDGGLCSNWWMPDVAAPSHTRGIYPPDMRCDHWLEMRWDAPASMYLQIGSCPHGGARNDGIVNHQAHILSPASATESHYFWAATRSHPPSEEGDAFLRGLLEQAFVQEDKVIIQAAFDNLDGADFWDMKPAFLGIDRGGTMARRILQNRVFQEGAKS